MAAIIPSRSRSRIDSIAQTNLRLVANDPSHRAKTAVMACLTACSSGNSELLRGPGRFATQPIRKSSSSHIHRRRHPRHLPGRENRVARIVRRGRRAATARAAIWHRQNFSCQEPASSALSTVGTHGLFRTVEPRARFSHRRGRVRTRELTFDSGADGGRRTRRSRSSDTARC
jgi:hypothetical protein